MKRKFTLILTISILISSAGITYAQWSQIGYMIGSATDTASMGFTFKHYGGDVYCGTNKGLYRSNDDGNTWQSLTFGSATVTNPFVRGVAVVSNGDIYAGTDIRLYKSSDNGSTWSWINVLPDNLIFLDITELNNTIIISYGDWGYGGVYYSTDNGATFTLATGLPNDNLFRFLIDGNTVYLGGSGGVYSSTDNGHTWAAAGTGFNASNLIADVVKKGSSFFAGDVWGNGMFTSTDNCATWVSVDTSVFHSFCQVFSTVESGTSILSSNSGTGCDSSGTQQIKISNDMGLTWTSFMGGLPTSHFFPIIGTNTAGSYYFAKEGFTPNVYRTGTPVLVQSGAMKNNDLTIYPNPVVNIIAISMKGNERKQIFIYDYTGKEIIRKETQSEMEQINVSDLSPGFYFIRVKSKSGNSSVSKFIKK